MRFDPDEIEAIADALAPRVADILEARLTEMPELAMSVAEAAAYCQVEPYCIRDAIEDGRLPALRLGRSVRIRRCDLFVMHANGEGG
jgi:excisionase family DNA binding protein